MTEGAYTVVICPDCQYVWIVSDRPERPGCGSCGRTTKFSKLKKYATTDDIAAARRVRARVVAQEMGEIGAFERAADRDQL